MQINELRKINNGLEQQNNKYAQKVSLLELNFNLQEQVIIDLHNLLKKTVKDKQDKAILEQLTEKHVSQLVQFK